MPIPDHMDNIRRSTEELWAAFGLDPMPYHLRDLRGLPWIEMGNEVFVAEIIDPDEKRDEIYNKAEYGGEIYGTSKWRTEGFTMVVVWNNGPLEAWLLTTGCKVEE